MIEVPLRLRHRIAILFGAKVWVGLRALGGETTDQSAIGKIVPVVNVGSEPRLCWFEWRDDMWPGVLHQKGLVP